MKKSKNRQVFLILLLFVSQTVCAQILEVHIKNIRGVKGQLCVAVFANEAGFKSEKTIWVTKCPKKIIVNGSFDLAIPVEPGQYGLSVLDDENMSGKMEYNLPGIPREGFGFSNYYHRRFCKPTFDNFSFIIEKNETKIITVTMKYF